MKRFLLVVIVLTALIAKAQNPSATELTVKSSPTEDVLVSLAKQGVNTQKVINSLLQQARFNLDQKNKPILEEMKKRSAKWQAKIDADTKDLKDQLDANQKEAAMKFQVEIGALQNQVVSLQTLKILEDIVRKEQGLPDNATFNPETQKWTVPTAKTETKPEEPAKTPETPKK